MGSYITSSWPHFTVREYTSGLTFRVSASPAIHCLVLQGLLCSGHSLVGTDTSHYVSTPLGPSTCFSPRPLFRYCPVRPFATSQESMYILTSDHFSLHTKFTTEYTPRSYAHWEDSLSHYCQGFTPSESVVWQHSFLACHNTLSPRTGCSHFHKLVIGNFPCGHSCELGER